MKKVLAIILSIAMLFGVLAINTFAETTPTVTVVTNEGSPVKEGTVTYFTIKFDNFSSIKGMDVIITADGGTVLGEEITITGFKDSTGADLAGVKDLNYTYSTSSIHIVDLTGSVDGKIVFSATAPAADANIKITGKYAETGEKLFEGNLDAEGTFDVAVPAADPVAVEIPEGETTVTVKQPADTGKFIPYGSVYKLVGGKYVYAPKGEDGNFTVKEADYVSQVFDIPAGGLGTFAVSDSIAKDAIRFGNYSNKNTSSDVKHGTMVFEGDWLALKEYYIKKGYEVEDIIALFSASYDKNIGDKDYVYYKVTDKENVTQQVNVYKFAQKNFMWKDGNSVLEYAVRINNVLPDTNYSAVAYSIDAEGNVTLSSTIKSVTTPAAK